MKTMVARQSVDARYVGHWVRSCSTVGFIALMIGSQSSAQQPGHPVVSASAQTDKSADEVLVRPLTIRLTNVSLKQAIDSVSRAANVFVQYQLPLLSEHQQPVTIDVRNTPLGVVLEQVLTGTALRAVPGTQGSLTIVPVSGTDVDSVPGVGSINGRVVDSATGRGLAGVTIRVAGTKIATTTRDSGQFTLHDVPVGTRTIAAKVFGYRPGERTIDVASAPVAVIRFPLAAVPTVLSGVVTTAAGQQRKIEVGNDITTINADSLMQVAPISSVTDILENRVPGMTVLHSSGTPGDPSRIRIRGAGSITGNNDPIVIVDGVRVYASQSDQRNSLLAPAMAGGTSRYAAPSPLDQIDPNSIQTIEVFKGPSASALYGSDAANGVIVITTKHGQAGPMHWNMDLNAGLAYQPRDWPANYYRFGYGQSSGTGSPFCTWNDLTCTQDSIVAYQALNDPRYNISADHGSSQSGSLTVSGGVPAMQYALTATATGNLGILKMPGIEQQRFLAQYGYDMPKWMVRPDRYDTFGGTGQLTVKPLMTAMVTLVSSLYSSTQQRSSLQDATTQLEGVYINPLLLGVNSLLRNEYQRATSNSITSANAVTVYWAPASWLPLNITGGLNTGQRVDKTYVPYGIFTINASNGIDSTGFYGLGRGTTMDKTTNVATTMPFRMFSVDLGLNYHDGSTNDFSALTDQLAPGVSDPSTFPLTQGATPLTQQSTDASTYGWYFQPRFNVASFFVAPGFRLDGGSASGANGGFSGTGLTGFPKIDLSYVMIDRQTNPLWGMVNLFRPRLALGVAGTQPGPTDKLRLFNSQGFISNQGTASVINLNGAFVPAAFLSTLGNTQLQPEQARELEGGFDTDLWRNRLSLTYTYHDKVRHNAIINVPVAPSATSGISNYNVNIGEIRGTGTELSATAQVLENRAVGWTIGLNYSRSKEVLVQLNSGRYVMSYGSGSTGTVSRNVVGYPLWGMWAQPILSYSDVNHDGVIEAGEVRYGDSVVYLGQQTPKSTVGMSNHLSLFHGTLSMNVEIAYEDGFTQFNGAALASGAISLLGNAPGTSLATQAAIQAAASANPISDIGVIQTVSMLRFQTLSINYQVPRVVARMFRVPHMQVALQGYNLGLHSNYRGIDPNVNAFATTNGGAEQSKDTGQLPLPKIWSLHVILGN